MILDLDAEHQCVIVFVVKFISLIRSCNGKMTSLEILLSKIS